MDFLLHSNAIWFVLVIALGFKSLYGRRKEGKPAGIGPVLFFIIGTLGLLLTVFDAMIKR